MSSWARISIAFAASAGYLRKPSHLMQFPRVRIERGGGRIGMPELLLDEQGIVAGLEQMRGVGVAARGPELRSGDRR